MDDRSSRPLDYRAGSSVGFLREKKERARTSLRCCAATTPDSARPVTMPLEAPPHELAAVRQSNPIAAEVLSAEHRLKE